MKAPHNENDAKTIPSQLGSGYSVLIERFPLRPLRDDSDLEGAIGVLNELIDRDSLDSGEEDYLEILGDVIAKYENHAHPIPSVSGEELLRFLIETNGLTQAEVAAGTGIHVTTVSQILSGKRRLRLPQVQSLADYFGLGVAAFLPKPEKKPEGGRKTMDRYMMATRVSRKLKNLLADNQVLAVANAFVAAQRSAWRGFQEIMKGERPGTPPELIARYLNVWGDGKGGCEFVSFNLTADSIQALASALNNDEKVWSTFREIVESEIPILHLSTRKSLKKTDLTRDRVACLPFRLQ